MTVTPLRAHRPRPLLERLACSLGVSVLTTALSTGLLVLLAVGLGADAGAANAIGVVCGIPVSYVGNRRWVWRRTGRGAILRELVPFWAMCLLGLVVSTVVVGRVGAATSALPATWRAVLLPIANAATFGGLWIVQFVLLDRVVFRTRTPRPARSVVSGRDGRAAEPVTGRPVGTLARARRRRRPRPPVHRSRLRRRRLARRRRPRALAPRAAASPTPTVRCSTAARSSRRRSRPGHRRFLSFDGIFYFGDVWLDGHYLGATEGYFFPHSFEITRHAGSRRGQRPRGRGREPAARRDRTAKRTITGVFSHWDNLDPDWNPGGIWRPVRVRDTGPVRISWLRVLCTEATEARGQLRLDVTPRSGRDATGGARSRSSRTVIDQSGHAPRRGGHPGRPDSPRHNTLRVTVVVDRPAALVAVAPRRPAAVCTSRCGSRSTACRSDHRRLTTAFRDVTVRDWQLVGERRAASS